MLTENEIIRAMCKYLRRKGYRILSVAYTKQKGDDIVAFHPSGQMLHVEAKGGTSSLKTSKNYGKPFLAKQIRGHYARALLRALVMLSPNKSIAIAVPQNSCIRKTN